MDADTVRSLYALPPGEFVSARNEAAQRAESKSDAAEIRKLRRPTVSAWAVNLLVADAPADVDALAELGERLRSAQAEMRGADLRELSSERNRTVAALVRRASALARAAGHPLPSAAEREVETTLDAAVADPDSSEAVRSGALTKALSYSGTGFTGSASQVIAFRRPATRGEAGGRREPAGEGGAGAGTRSSAGSRTEAGAKPEARTGGGAERAAGGAGGAKGTSEREKGEARARKEAAARREARKRAVEKAQGELEKAKARRADAREALDEARGRREAAAAERHRLRGELEKAERAVARADDRVGKAASQVDAAEAALDQARHRLSEARAGRVS